MLIRVSKEIYPLEAVLQACYQFLERAYFFIDMDQPGNKIRVHITGKGRSLNRSFRNIFLEELLHSALRYRLAGRNRKLREYIVGSALFSRDMVKGKKFTQRKSKDALR
ncbi:MAG: hypothetical protein HQL20_01795 [Candidatus Omnitrophica bacterium]|nr:hypothetical protein [Candidatus Omnitrophota bacterium]